MTHAELLEIIARAEREGWTELDLAENNLEVLPPEIGRLKKLEKLILGIYDFDNHRRRGNQLTNLPKEIAQLTNLKELYLSHNEIHVIPDVIFQLKNLQILWLTHNYIKNVPDEIIQLIKLERLDLDRNKINVFPEVATKLVNLHTLLLDNNNISLIPETISSLKKLQRLDLNNNHIDKISEAIFQLTNLKKLRLDHNQIDIIPNNITKLFNLETILLHHNLIRVIPNALTELYNLEEISLSDNHISEIPDTIANLFNLRILRIGNNEISVIPDAIAALSNLQVLRIGNNHISIIPDIISRLSNLQVLHIGANNISIIPNSIVQLSKLEILNIHHNLVQFMPDDLSKLTKLKELNLQGNPLSIPREILNDNENHAAIIAYWQKLKQGKRKLNEAKVILVGHGAVGKTSLVRRLIDRDFNPDENKTEGIDIRHWEVKAREEKVRLRVWDFGGQEIMHATHQFFLTERSLYLLVLNARKDEGNNDVEYWLKIIESFGKDAPVLVIANKSDEHPLKLNRRHLQDKYPNIQAFFETSCKTGLGIDELRNAIAQQITAMDHVFNVLPLQWFRLKEQIEKIDRDHISYLEYEQLCATEEISDKQERRDLIRLLHLLGIVLNFAEDTRLQDTNVLNPEWVTGGVYRILNDNLLSTKHKGMLATKELDRILKPKTKDDRDCYRDNRDRQFILDMMQKFELCFPLDTSSRNPSYLIPELLDEEEPDTGNWENTLNFEYHYKILFSSIISRFIVKMNHYISRRTYWRTGVILASSEGNRAYIKADLTDAKIFIRIDGNECTRRSFLFAIRSTFESIHKDIAALEVDDRVPLPDNPTVSISYKHLLKLEARGETNYFPENAERDYNIRLLLDGIEEKRSRIEKEESRGITNNFYEKVGQVTGGNTTTHGKNIGMQNNNQNIIAESLTSNTTKNQTKSMKTILMLAANPKNTVNLRLQEEERDIKERLRLAGYGTEPIKSAVAVRPRDIQQSILDFKPQIIHFSGHGANENGLVFEDIDGTTKLISGDDLADLFDLFSDRIECVVLNACYSEVQAEAIKQKIQYVIGMDQAIGDRAAIEFAVGFYAAIGAGESYKFAHKLGCNAIRLAGINEHSTPQLLTRD
jgi:small GTP-binding protein